MKKLVKGCRIFHLECGSDTHIRRSTQGVYTLEGMDANWIYILREDENVLLQFKRQAVTVMYGIPAEVEETDKDPYR